MSKEFAIPRFALPAIAARVGARLPQWPHSVALAAALNVARAAGVFPPDALAGLEGKTFRVTILDAGSAADFALLAGRFKPLLRPGPSADLRLSANLAAFLQLLARQEDPDTLFFHRRLLIEGDTELGLAVKNMLDAIDWSAFARLPMPPPLRRRFGSTA
ncbi:MAG: SCP2 sterol-binding domain-containing protein [Burkholderiales bacterium]|jgi:predicted lipid carrier protein YhbT|nr:SCP2 sterol-binding domain-containing protein [Burkholderiales bacterium]